MARTSTARRRVDPTSPFPFSKVLIANRGEIAVRVIRACRDLGLASVAVYSDADRLAPHVRMADEAVHLGPPPAAESYLNPQKLIEAALRTGAGAVHPGYGFLSENAGFADACEAAGLIFVGPPGRVMRAMGEKTAARRVAEQAGVPVVPGYGAGLEDAAEAARWAEKIGYPVMLKAAAGGGGKGIRFVQRPEELEAALRLARSEAQGRVRRQHGLSGEGGRPGAAHRGADSRRRARQRHSPGRARVLDPAAPPEAHRGVAFRRAGRGDARANCWTRRCGWRRRRATSTRGRASSCWGRTSNSTSWRSTRVCRSSIQ